MTRAAASETRTADRSARGIGEGTAFWVVGAAFVVAMAFSTVPTPLYPLYQERDGFSAFVVTVIFAAYAVGVMASLYLAGHVSDWLGRRRVMMAALSIEIVAAVMFVFLRDVTSLIVARLVTGLGVGMVTATATAHLSELRSIARPDEDPARARRIATAVNLGGLACGPVFAGVLAQYVSWPLVLPYATFVGLLAIAALGVAVAPETVTIEHRRYRPQRVAVPPGERATFTAAAVGVAGAFAVTGVFTAVTATFVGKTLHDTSHLVAGATVTAVMASSAGGQLVLAFLPDRRQLQVGAAGMVVGLLAIIPAALGKSLPVFVAAGVVAGCGLGLVFRSAIAVAGLLSGPDNRGEVLAGMFLAAYAGLTVPVIAVGLVLQLTSPQTALVVFALVITAVAVVTSTVMLRSSFGRVA